MSFALSRDVVPGIGLHRALGLPDDVELPVGWISPIITGFDRWWLVFITDSKPEGAFTFWPYIAWRTASTLVVPACSTACVHILKPM